MTTIANEINIINEGKNDVAQTLINLFGVQAMDLYDADHNLTSSGLQDENGTLKRLNAWAPILENTTLYWADLQISNTSNVNTSPTFKTINIYGNSKYAITDESNYLTIKKGLDILSYYQEFKNTNNIIEKWWHILNNFKVYGNLQIMGNLSVGGIIQGVCTNANNASQADNATYASRAGEATNAILANSSYEVSIKTYSTLNNVTYPLLWGSGNTVYSSPSKISVILNSTANEYLIKADRFIGNVIGNVTGNAIGLLLDYSYTDSNLLDKDSLISEENKLHWGTYYNAEGPSTYGNLITLGNSGKSLLALSWDGSLDSTSSNSNNIGRLYYRSKRDVASYWTNWKTIAWLTDVVTEIGTDQDYLTWTKGSSIDNIIIPYATKTKRIIPINENNTTEMVSSSMWFYLSQGVHSTNILDNKADAASLTKIFVPSGEWQGEEGQNNAMGVRLSFNNDYWTDIFVGTGTGALRYRRVAGGSSGTVIDWRTLIDSNNIGNYKAGSAGNADSATKLSTSHTIWGQSFDGTNDITGNLTNNSITYLNGTYTFFGTNGIYFEPNQNNSGASLCAHKNYAWSQSIASFGENGDALFYHKVTINDTLNVGTSGMGHIHMMRSSTNYFTAPTNGDFAFIVDGYETNFWDNRAFSINASKNCDMAGELTAGLDSNDSWSIFGKGRIELYGGGNVPTPYIDFHYNGSTSDCTSRIIESQSGQLTIDANLIINKDTTLNGDLYIKSYRIYNDSDNNALRFDGNIITNGNFLLGGRLIRGVETTENINANKAINYIECSNNYTLNVPELYSGQELTIIIKNTTSGDTAKSIIVTIPNTSPYINLDEENLEIRSEKFGEISILCIEKSNNKIYLISSKS